MESAFLVGGVNTPFQRPDHCPKSIRSADGCRVVTGDGHELIDMSMAYGAQVFGHADDSVAAAATDVLSDGWLFTEPHELLTDVASSLERLFPSAERGKFVTTGSDAVAYALRSARSFTGREKILQTTGSYHGVHERLTDSAGLPDTVSDVVTEVPFNDVEAAARELNTHEYAALIVEPVLKDDGCVPATHEFLSEIRERCTETDTTLVFDEVLTGCRLAEGGAQAYYGVIPDVTTVSKSLASGLPLSAVFGKAEYLQELMPEGDVFVAGTLNANPVGLAGAKETLEHIEQNAVCERLNKIGDELRLFISNEIDARCERGCVQGIGSITSIAPDLEVTAYDRGLSFCDFDENAYYEFASAAREAGLLLPPYHNQAMYVSLAHGAELDQVKSKFVRAIDIYKS